jgi:pyruvate-ferredoxin/flavodoxin oxidoreductase
VPSLHFFDGFRTSHEVTRIETLSNADLLALPPADRIAEHRARALTPDHPMIRGTAQNRDTFFQAREACNAFYAACPQHVAQMMAQLGAMTGRHYSLFDYIGHPEAERVIVLMGSRTETAHETVDALTARGEKVGVVKIWLYRPFAADLFRGDVAARGAEALWRGNINGRGRSARWSRAHRPECSPGDRA